MLPRRKCSTYRKTLQIRHNIVPQLARVNYIATVFRVCSHGARTCSFVVALVCLLGRQFHSLDATLGSSHEEDTGWCDHCCRWLSGFLDLGRTSWFGDRSNRIATLGRKPSNQFCDVVKNFLIRKGEATHEIPQGVAPS